MACGIDDVLKRINKTPKFRYHLLRRMTVAVLRESNDIAEQDRHVLHAAGLDLVRRL